MRSFGFEKLKVWQESKDFSVRVYKVTSSFPSEEKFGLTSQMRRAGVSVSSNIAEGSSRVSPKDQAHFYHMAYSSLMEVLSQLLIAKELEFVTDEVTEELKKEISKISYKLNSLRKSALSKTKD